MVQNFITALRCIQFTVRYSYSYADDQLMFDCDTLARRASEGAILIANAVRSLARASG